MVLLGKKTCFLWTLSSWSVLEGVEMGSMNGGAVLGWRGEEGAPRDAQCFSELSKELDLSSLGEATHLDSFAPATLVYAHLISKDWFFFFFFFFLQKIFVTHAMK